MTRNRRGTLRPNADQPKGKNWNRGGLCGNEGLIKPSMYKNAVKKPVILHANWKIHIKTVILRRITGGG